MIRFHTPYPNYNVLDKWHSPSWDTITRQVIARRLRQIPERRFLDPDRYAVLVAVCNRLLPQPERRQPVPIAPWIDDKLVRNQGSGYRYADLPPLREAWQQGLTAIDAESRQRFEVGFTELNDSDQDRILAAIQHGDTVADDWQTLPAQRFFNALLLNDVVAMYYAHPAAWSEIGFGGPASPRGYLRLGIDRRDPWEAAHD